MHDEHIETPVTNLLCALPSQFQVEAAIESLRLNVQHVNAKDACGLNDSIDQARRRPGVAFPESGGMLRPMLSTLQPEP